MVDVDMEPRDNDPHVRRIEQGRASKQVITPTDADEVKCFLRALGEPVTLFGEGKLERRERLRTLLAELDQEAIERLQQAIADTNVRVGNFIVDNRPEGRFFTEGPEELRKFRIKVAKYSLDRARERLQAERTLFEARPEGAESAAPDLDYVRELTNQASELADVRPVVSCAFSPNNEHIAVASWSGKMKVWGAETLKVTTTTQAHEERLTSVVWHPSETYDETLETVRLATGSADCTAKLWTMGGILLRTLEGHADRLARMAMHPMGEHMATASFDHTWRLWDLETGVAILEQEGHSRPVYSVCFNCDGSLCVSGGLDGYARIWDTRTGRTVSVLKGHARGVVSVDFSPNGWIVASGSDDNTARVWDLRKNDSLAVLPGHSKLISDVRFSRSGDFLVTGSFDKTIKVWEIKRTAVLLTTTLTTSSRVMGLDVGIKDGLTVASCEWNKTLKIWSAE